MKISPLFEAVFSKRGAIFDVMWDLLDNIEDLIKFDPRSFGEHRFTYDEREFWIYEAPSFSRMPTVIILFEIDDENGNVILWNFTFKNSASLPSKLS
jgi:hypothetical protein